MFDRSWRMALSLFHLIALAPILLSTEARGCLAFAATPFASQVAYDPFNPVAASASISMEVKNISGKRCDGAIAFFKASKAEALSADGGRLSYAIESLSGSNAINIASLSGAQLAKENVLPLLGMIPGETRTVNFYLRAPAGQIIPPGSYLDMVQAALYQNYGSRLVETGRPMSLPVTISVAAIMSINIAGGGQYTTLDFGELSAGAERSAVIQSRSNERYRLTASSENGGVLKLDPPSPDGIAWRIPYTIRIGGSESLVLAAGKKVEIKRPATGLAGANLPVEVKIGDIGEQRAGHYKDLIVLTIDAAP